MLKNICFICLFLIFTPTSAKAFLGDNLSFKELANLCVNNVAPDSMSRCNSYGFNYEVLETSLLTEDGDPISFKTKVVLSGEQVLVQSNEGFTISCNSCVSDKIDIQAVLTKFKNSFESANKTNAFNTKKIMRNNKKTADITQNNNGSSFSDEFSYGIKVFTEIFKGLMSKDDSKLIFIENAEGKPHALVSVNDGKYVLVVDFTKATRSSDGSVSFTGGLSSGGLNDYMKSVGIIFGGMRCRTTYTGSDDIMVAKTTCW